MKFFVTRLVIPVGILALIGLAADASVSLENGRALSFSLLAGAAFGIVLQRSRFCFLCNFRDFVEKREPQGLIAILVALAAGGVFYHIVMMAWAPAPLPEMLPPNAHIGPVGPVLALAAFVFGLGMAVSGSCLSAHLYRLGEGSPTSLFALVGAAIGFFIGFLTWNPLYILSIHASPTLWLPHMIGYTGTVLLSLFICTGLAIVILILGRTEPSKADLAYDLHHVARRLFVDRWPPAIAGLAIAAISAFTYFRVAPLGVTAELGSIVRTTGSTMALLPDTLHGLDGLRGCATAVKQAILSPNGLFIVGLVLASFASALTADKFRPQFPTGGQIFRGLTGGILMGWAAMTGLGCTVGVLLSGIHAGAVSGWLFLIFCAGGAFVGLWLLKRTGLAA